MPKVKFGAKTNGRPNEDRPLILSTQVATDSACFFEHSSEYRLILNLQMLLLPEG